LSVRWAPSTDRRAAGLAIDQKSTNTDQIRSKAPDLATRESYDQSSGECPRKTEAARLTAALIDQAGATTHGRARLCGGTRSRSENQRQRRWRVVRSAGSAAVAHFSVDEVRKAAPSTRPRKQGAISAGEPQKDLILPMVCCALRSRTATGPAGESTARLHVIRHAAQLVGRFHGSNRMPTKLNCKDVAATQGLTRNLRWQPI
jgi:hypothetical protein